MKKKKKTLVFTPKTPTPKKGTLIFSPRPSTKVRANINTLAKRPRKK